MSSNKVRFLSRKSQVCTVLGFSWWISSTEKSLDGSWYEEVYFLKNWLSRVRFREWTIATISERLQGNSRIFSLFIKISVSWVQLEPNFSLR